MLLETLTDKLKKFMEEDFVQVVLSFLSFIPKIMYFLVGCLLSFIDFFQITFRKLAGLDPYILHGNVVTGDTVYNIITESIFGNKYPALNTTFWALIILGIFMLIVCTLFAVIRIEYKPEKEKGNSKSNIIKNFFTALVSFAVIPIASFFAMFLANELVQVVDYVITNTHATSQVDKYTYFDQWDINSMDNDETLYYAGSGGNNKPLLNSNAQKSYIAFNIFGYKIPTTTEPFSGLMFKASAYSCNRFRLHGDDYLQQVKNVGANFGLFQSGQLPDDANEVAAIIDTAFSINAKMKTPENLKTTIENSKGDENVSNDYYRAGWFPVHWGAEEGNKNVTNFSKYNVELVWYFYDLWMFNYIVAFVGLFSLGKFYFQYTLMLMNRFFQIMALLLFAPIVVSTMPLDSSVSDRWRKQYVSNYAFLLFMVFAIDVISPLLSIVQDIALFNVPLLDYIISALFVIAGLNVVSTLTAALAKIIGDRDAAEAWNNAQGAADRIQNDFSKGVAATGSAFRVATLPMKVAGHATAWGIGKGLKIGRAEMEKKHIREGLESTYGIKDGKGLRSASNPDLENIFAKTKTAQDLTANGVKTTDQAYINAQARFVAMARAGSDNKVQNHTNWRRVQRELVGGEAWNKKQANIQNTNARLSRYSDNILTGMGKAKERYTPWVNSASQDLSNLAGNLPFIGGLFGKPKGK